MINERNKKNDDLKKNGEKEMDKNIKYLVAGFFAIYGFLSFTDPVKYPILSGIVSEYAKYDRAIGLFLMVVAFYIFTRKE